MKATYQKPAMVAVKLQQCHVLATSEVRNVSSNADIILGGAGDGPVHVKESNLWDEEW